MLSKFEVVKVLGTPVCGNGGPMDPNSENAFSEGFVCLFVCLFFTKLSTYLNYSKTLILAKEKLKNNIRFGK